MKRIKTNWITILLLCILGFSVYNNFKKQKEIKSLEYEVSDLESDKSRLQEQVDSVQQLLDECESDKNAAKVQNIINSNIEVVNPYKEYYEANYQDNPDGTVTQKEN